MADISNFLISWWYSPNTKLAINYTTVGANQSAVGLDYRNGVADSTDEEYVFRNRITMNPVENSTSISDNIIIEPRMITISGIITAIQSFSLFGAVTESILLDFTQLNKAAQKLQEFARSKQLLTLTTGLYFGTQLFKLENVVIRDLKIPKNNQSGSSLRFNIVFQEIIITNSDAAFSAKSSQGTLDSTAGGPNG